MASTPKAYSSPLDDELELETIKVGTDVIVHHDKKNKRLLVDIPIGERRKISQSGNSMLLANAKYEVPSKGAIIMNLNVWDAQFTEEELPKLKDFLEVKKQQADLKQQLKDLQAK